MQCLKFGTATLAALEGHLDILIESLLKFHSFK